jgi:hypothetical protein
MNVKRTIPPLLVVILVFGLSKLNGKSESNNQFFVTFAVNEGTSLPRQAQVQAAVTAKESRPAKQDPEGNWSEAVNGFQLSLRVEKKSFRLDEPIWVDTFLRNVSGQPLKRTFVSGKGFESKLCRFLVTRDGAEPVERTGQEMLFALKERTLFAAAQWKCPVRLDEMFKMDTPGLYNVTGVTGVGEPSQEIRTGTVVIQVLASDSAAPLASNAAAPRPDVVNSIPVRFRNDDPPHSSNNSPPTSPMSVSSSKRPPSVFNPSNTLAISSPTVGTVSVATTTNTPARKTGIAIIAALLALLLAILWRAARRKPAAVNAKR